MAVADATTKRTAPLMANVWMAQWGIGLLSDPFPLDLGDSATW